MYLIPIKSIPFVLMSISMSSSASLKMCYPTVCHHSLFLQVVINLCLSYLIYIYIYYFFAGQYVMSSYYKLENIVFSAVLLQAESYRYCLNIQEKCGSISALEEGGAW